MGFSKSAARSCGANSSKPETDMAFCDSLGTNTRGTIPSTGRGALLFTVWEQSITLRSILPVRCRAPGLWGPHAVSGPAICILPKEASQAMMAQPQPSELLPVLPEYLETSSSS